MANKFQKLLFNLSTVSPIAVFLVAVWWIQCGVAEVTAAAGTIQLTTSSVIVSIIGLIALLFSFYSVIIVKICRKHCEVVAIQAKTVESNDRMAIGAILSYLLPFATLTLSNYNQWLSLAIFILAFLAVVLMNTVLPNPVLMCWGYHFYKISNANSAAGFTLISKREKIKNAETIQKVIPVWDYFLIEEE